MLHEGERTHPLHTAASLGEQLCVEHARACCLSLCRCRSAVAGDSAVHDEQQRHASKRVHDWLNEFLDQIDRLAGAIHAGYLEAT